MAHYYYYYNYYYSYYTLHNNEEKVSPDRLTFCECQIFAWSSVTYWDGLALKLSTDSSTKH